MATRLTNLEVKEISFCKNGAQPNAKIEIFKSVDSEPVVKESKLEMMLDKIMKTLKIDKDQPQVVTKGLFSEKWESKELRNNFYEVFWVLDDTVWQIMNDEEITDKAAKIKEAITEFATIAISNLPTENIQKYMEVRKNLLDPVKEQINKALEPAPIVKQEENNSEGGKEEMTEEQINKLVETITKSVTESIISKLPEITKAAVAEDIKQVQDNVTKVTEKVEEIGKIAPNSKKLEGSGDEVPIGKEDIAKDFWKDVI